MPYYGAHREMETNRVCAPYPTHRRKEMRTIHTKMKRSGFKWKLSQLLGPKAVQTAKPLFFAALMLLSSLPEARAEVSLIIDDTGQMTGATGVVVGTKTYDVSFVAGACVDLFSGCDGPEKFTFTTMQDAKLAASALGATVILDSKKGNFDSIPSMVRGCTGTVTSCSIMTPFGFSADAPDEISAMSFVNAPRKMEIGPITGASNFVAPDHVKDKKTKPIISVWAVWTSPAPKP